MSNFIDSLTQRLEALKKYLADEELSEAALRVVDIVEWIDDEQGTDLDDMLSDFEDGDIKAEFLNYRLFATGYRVIKLADINAEAELDQILEDFKQKYTLTEIHK